MGVKRMDCRLTRKVIRVMRKCRYCSEYYEVSKLWRKSLVNPVSTSLHAPSLFYMVELHGWNSPFVLVPPQ